MANFKIEKINAPLVEEKQTARGVVIFELLCYNQENCRKMTNRKGDIMAEKKTSKKGKKIPKSVIIAIIAVLVVVIGLGVVFGPSGKTTFSVETALKEVLADSELLTAEYTYNSIARIKTKENEIKYQIAYKGEVKSGFDFEKIKVEEKENKYIIIIPKIEIKTTTVDPDLEYIFTKQKYDTENTYQEAFNACEKDLKRKAQENESLQNTAIESAVETVKAFAKPFEKNLEEGKTIEVVYVDDYSKEAK